MTKLIARIGSAGQALIDLALPPRCATCRELTRGQAGLCPRCWSALTFIDAPRCAVSGLPFPYGIEGDDLVSPAALRSPPLYGRARGAVIYDDDSRRLVHAIKYHDRHEAALPMARLMAVAGRDVIAASDMLVPVPLHRWRLWRRSYNQAASPSPASITGWSAGAERRPRSASIPGGGPAMSGGRLRCCRRCSRS